MAGSSVYEPWFKLADEDRDGFIAGGEAVTFLKRSGLQQECLGQVWELASGGGAKLNRMQFAAAMSLVALAQASGGQLPISQARAVMAGVGPAMPPPKMNGLEPPAGAPAASTAAASTAATAAPFAPAPSQQQQQQQQQQQYGQVAAAGGYSVQMTGGSAYGAMSQPGYTLQMTGGSAVYMPQMTGGSSAAGYVPQMTGGSMYYTPQMTGMSVGGAPPPPPSSSASAYSLQLTGASGAGAMAVAMMPDASGGAAGGGGFPPATPDDMAGYAAKFQSLDADRDGVVQGKDCFSFFMQWGLDKAVLRDVWSLVAGDAGQLNATQFAQCLYLMDCAKRGMRLPAHLPPGRFPPTASTASASAAGGAAAPAAAAAAPPPPQQQWSLQSQYAASGMTMAAAGAALSAQAPGMPYGGGGGGGMMPQMYAGAMPSLPGLPPKAEFTADAHPPTPTPSKMPSVDPGLMAALHGGERSKLESEMKQSGGKEAALFDAQHTAEMAKRKNELYNRALQELMMFKSRTDVALLQAQDQANRLQSEADALAKRYSQAYAAAEAQSAQGGALREHIAALAANKAEAAARLQQLESELAALAAMTPEQLAAMTREVDDLQERVHACESEKALKGAQSEALRGQKDALQRRLNELQLALAAADAELGEAKRDVEALQSQVGAAKASPDAAQLQGLLTKAARAYKALFNHAQKSGIEVPYQAQPASIGHLAWVEDVVSCAAEWLNDEADNRGFVVVSALPELDEFSAMPPPSAAALGGAAASSTGAAAFGSGAAAAAKQQQTKPAMAAAKAQQPDLFSEFVFDGSGGGAGGAAAAQQQPSQAVSKQQPTAFDAFMTGVAANLTAAATAAAAPVVAPPPLPLASSSSAGFAVSFDDAPAAPGAVSAPPGGFDFDASAGAANAQPFPSLAPPPATAGFTPAAAAAAGGGSGSMFDDDAFGDKPAF